jgi:membrane peptidoglycan carboxypeptidase
MGSRKFRIEQFGNTYPGFINESFMHTAYEKGLAVRTFEVGPGNPAFRQLNQIAPSLRNAIMTSEDGGFFFHRGFLPDAIRDALILDLKERRFARGGSTISMQLVKNVFLNRNKTITRKLEEILLTWLIENCRLSTKERMYEVYLNIIEMGPMVYGVEEGSRFYFGKDVSKLSLAESVFMASIVPRPKKFMYAFDANGSLKPYLSEYYKLMAIKMLAKGYITEAEAAGLSPSIKLTGAAQKMLIHSDTIPQDSIVAKLPLIRN